MSNSQSKEESEEKSFTNQAHQSGNDLSNSEIRYEIIVTGGETK